MTRVFPYLLLLLSCLGAQVPSDTLVYYLITGINGGPPFYQLHIDSGGATQVMAFDLSGVNDSATTVMDADELDQIETLFQENGFQDLLDSNLISACLSCPMFGLMYRGDSIMGNTPTRFKNLNVILTALDSLIQDLLKTSPVTRQENRQNSFNLYENRLEVRFPHEVKLYDARGVLLHAYRSPEEKEYLLADFGSPLFIKIVDTSIGMSFQLRR